VIESHEETLPVQGEMYNSLSDNIHGAAMYRKRRRPRSEAQRRAATIAREEDLTICGHGYTMSALVYTVKTEGAENSLLTYLWQCLLQSSPHVVEDMAVIRTRYKKGKDPIKGVFEGSEIHPWAALTALQAPKFFSDQVGSVGRRLP